MKMTPNLALTVFCALLGFAMGCGQAQFHLGGGYTMGDVGAALLLSIATFIWIREDAWRHSYARSPAFNVSFVGLTLFALPYYLIKTRGLGRGLIAMGLVIVGYVLIMFSAVLGVLFIRFLKV